MNTRGTSYTLLACFSHRDSGATHSIISRTLINRSALVIRKSAHPMIVEVAPTVPVCFNYNKAGHETRDFTVLSKTAYDDTRTCSYTDYGGAGHYRDCGRHILC